MRLCVIDNVNSLNPCTHIENEDKYIEGKDVTETFSNKLLIPINLPIRFVAAIFQNTSPRLRQSCCKCSYEIYSRKKLLTHSVIRVLAQLIITGEKLFSRSIYSGTRSDH